MATPRHDDDPRHPGTPPEGQPTASNDSGLSFEAEPTGLPSRPNEAPGAEEPYRAQAEETSRPGLTPGSEASAHPQAAARPKGFSGMALVVIGGLLLLLILFVWLT